jgi:hypothetical protein
MPSAFAMSAAPSAESNLLDFNHFGFGGTKRNEGSADTNLERPSAGGSAQHTYPRSRHEAEIHQPGPNCPLAFDGGDFSVIVYLKFV